MVPRTLMCQSQKLASGDCSDEASSFDEQNAHSTWEPCAAKARIWHLVIAKMMPVHLVNKTRMVPLNPVLPKPEVGIW